MPCSGYGYSSQVLGTVETLSSDLPDSETVGGGVTWKSKAKLSTGHVSPGSLDGATQELLRRQRRWWRRVMVKLLLTTHRLMGTLGLGEGTPCCIVEASGLFRRGETGTEQNHGARGSGSGSGSSVEPCQPGTLFLQR